MFKNEQRTPNSENTTQLTEQTNMLVVRNMMKDAGSKCDIKMIVRERKREAIKMNESRHPGKSTFGKPKAAPRYVKTSQVKAGKVLLHEWHRATNTRSKIKHTRRSTECTG